MSACRECRRGGACRSAWRRAVPGGGREGASQSSAAANLLATQCMVQVGQAASWPARLAKSARRLM